MSLLPGLIHSRNIRAPEFKLNDSIVRARESSTLISSGTSIVSPAKKFDVKSAFRTTPITTGFNSENETRNNTMIQQQPILSEFDASEPHHTEVIPIHELYNVPGPSHRRNRSEIPNISLQKLEASAVKQAGHARELSVNVSKSFNLLPSGSNVITQNMTTKNTARKRLPISLSIHASDDNMKFDHYLEYLSLNTDKNELRKNFESRTTGPKRARVVFSMHKPDSLKLNDAPEKDQHPISLIKLNLKSSPSRKDKLPTDKDSPSTKNNSSKLVPNIKDAPLELLSGAAGKSSNNSNANTNRKTNREILGSLLELDDIVQSPKSVTSSSAISPNRKAGSRSPQKSKLSEKWHNEYERMLTELAYNLENLYIKVKNEQKVDSVIEKFCDRNKILMNLLNKQPRKPGDFSVDKLIRRFKLIEFGPEPSFVPLRIKKKKMGISFINPEYIPRLENISKSIEVYLSTVRKAELKMIEDHLLDAEKKLDQIQKEKFKAMKLNGKIKEFMVAQKILDAKPRIDPFYFYKFDPVREYEKIKESNTYGDISYINPKNIEHARTLSEVFENWTSLINKKIN